MILPTDIPTRAQLEGLLAARVPQSVSIYLPTSPSSRGDAARIELKNLAGEAVRQLRQAGAERNDIVAIEEAVADLIDDDEFWRYQARSLALFLTPTRGTTLPAAAQPDEHRRSLRSLPSQAAPACADVPAHGLRARALTGERPPARDRTRARPGGGRCARPPE